MLGPGEALKPPVAKVSDSQAVDEEFLFGFFGSGA